MSFKNDAKEKVKNLQKYGIIAYKASFSKNLTLNEVLKLPINTQVSTAGRIVFIRNLGTICFIKIQNIETSLQILYNKNIKSLLIANEDIMKYLNIGDIIGVTGEIVLSKTNEKSISPEEIVILSKCVEQIGEKWHGIVDVELKLRKRYLDLISNEETRKIFQIRHNLIKNIRNFFWNKNFIEVETPILQNIPSGASAYPFKTHYESLNEDFFLRIAPELFLKRLLVAGYEKIFEIGKCFRNEGIDRSHLQEFSMLECYISYINYQELQKFAIELLQFIIKNTMGSLFINNINYENITLLSYEDLFLKYANFSIKDKSYEDLKKIAISLNFNISEIKSFDALKDFLYKKLCLSKIIDPVLVYDYPSSPLSYPQEEKKGYNYQFQIIIGNFEIIKSCIELTDPEIQSKNFLSQKIINEELKEKEIVREDEDFISALEVGMPPAGGLGLGIDRLLMLLTNTQNIREVILFPATKLK